jgi:uncharacterized membrane protein
MTPTAKYQNIYGRQWGRGIRPYLLFPKIIFVGIFLGGLVNLLVLVLLQPTPATAGDWHLQVLMIHRAYAYVIIPALIGTLAMGLLLLSTHFRAFAGMRWFQLKIMLVVICVPVLHTFMRSRFMALQAVLAHEDLTAAAAIRLQLQWGTVGALAFALTVIFLGRIKPRLGQNYARTFTQRNVPAVKSID